MTSAAHATFWIDVIKRSLARVKRINMGMNLISCCHRCKERCFHFRGEEQKTIMPFYKRHVKCMKVDRSSVETFEDQHQERDWMCGRNGYADWSPGIEFICPIHGKQELDSFGTALLRLKCKCRLEKRGTKFVFQEDGTGELGHCHTG